MIFKRPNVWATLLGAAPLLSGISASAQAPSFGPLTFEEGGPLQRMSYTPTTDRAGSVGRGAWGVALWMGYSNIFEQDSTATHRLFVDMERLQTTVTARYGVTDGLEVGGRLAFETTGGGILDPFISWWHTKLSLGNANRERFPSNGYGYRLEGPRGKVLLDVGSTALALEELRLFAKWRVAQSDDARSLISLRGTARFPTARNRVGSERADVDLSALGQLARGRWYLHGMLGASMLRASPELDPVLRSSRVYLMLGAERPLNDRLAVLAQYSVGSPALRGFRNRELDWPTFNLVFGLAGLAGETWAWEVSFQEDVPADTPAVDFTLGIRLSHAWPRRGTD